MTSLLITGGTGLSGSAIVRECDRLRLPVRALIRDPGKARAFADMSMVEPVVGDMLQPETLTEALTGIRRVLMISSPRERMVETQCAFIDAAKAAGVAHIVKFGGRESGIGFDSDAFRGTRAHVEIERYLEASGLAWTHLRPSQFMQYYLPQTITGVDPVTRELVTPIGDSRLAPVDIVDIAKVAVALLQAEGQERRAYDMTGPEALTMDEVVERISAATGVEHRHVRVSTDGKREELARRGYPAELIDLLDELFSERRKRVTSAIRLDAHEVFGVEPTTFAQFARRNAAALLGDE